MHERQLNNSLEKQKGMIMGGIVIFLLVFVFFTWVMIESDPNERLDKVCKPTVWAGKAVVAMTDLVDQDLSGHSTRFFEEFNYGCRYVFWKMFYYEDYVVEEARQVKDKVDKVISSDE